MNGQSEATGYEPTVIPGEAVLPIVSADVPVPSIYTGPRRYQIRFSDTEAYFAAQATEAPATFRTAVANSKRGVLGIEVPTSISGPVTALRNEADALEYFAREYGAVIMEDYQYAMDFTHVFESGSFLDGDQALASLNDVTAMIRADQCWVDSTGEDVVIAVVDTGIDGSHPEFPVSKRAGAWQEPSETPWTDWKGHGTMCAAIAGGTKSNNGRYNGVAPGARLIACKTRFYDTQLAAVYDYLIGLVETEGWKIVATNSYGIATGEAPPPPKTAFKEALQDAIAAGISVVFSAGNYHELTGGDPLSCAPTSIWQYKCQADILTVGTCKLDRTMWSYSSRGPGQHFGAPEAGEKPDVVAPTPANGAILYGNQVRVLQNGWGTSGAAPQAAGLAALLLSRRPDLNSGEVFDLIRNTAVSLGHGRGCEGRGMVDCRAALDHT